VTLEVYGEQAGDAARRDELRRELDGVLQGCTRSPVLAGLTQEAE
jgi:hypothetical protein